MKKPLYMVLLLLASVALLPGCKKDKKKPEASIDATNLTACPDGADCELLFTEHATVSDGGILQTGAYRVFWNFEERPGVVNRLYILAPMGDSFELSANDIATGRVKVINGCAACYAIPFIPVGGYVKGINTTPGKRADQTKWLIEAKIYREATGGAGGIKDTLYVKQYFYPNFVID